MRISLLFPLAIMIGITLSACAEKTDDSISNTSDSQVRSEVDSQVGAQTQKVRDPVPLAVQPKEAFEEIEWTDLLPEMDLLALQNPPEELSAIEDGSEEDVISGKLGSTDIAPADSPFQQALVSTSVVAAMQGKAIKLPGFIVPLEFDDNQTITEFFLVPYFGACIHLPPPPPNQIIYVTTDQGIQVDALYDPFWIYGVVDAGITENTTATSAYRMALQHIEPYYDTAEDNDQP